MRTTAKIGRIAAAFAIAVGVASAPRSSPADQAAPETATAEVVTASAIVQKIDKDSRVVTLRGEKGNLLDVKVSPTVKLDRLKVGDRVNAAYYQEVAISLHKSGAPGPKMTQTVTERGGVTAQQTTLVANVVSVDPSKNTVMLRTPQGEMHSLQVQDPDLQAQLPRIKPGDSVDVTYTQAVADLGRAAEVAVARLASPIEAPLEIVGKLTISRRGGSSRANPSRATRAGSSAAQPTPQAPASIMHRSELNLLQKW